MLLDLNLANKKTLIAWTLGQLLHLGLQQLLNASLPRIIFHSPELTWIIFLSFSPLRQFILYTDENDFALSLILAP